MVEKAHLVRSLDAQHFGQELHEHVARPGRHLVCGGRSGQGFEITRHIEIKIQIHIQIFITRQEEF